MSYNFRTGQYEDTSAPSEVFPGMGSTPGYDHNQQFPGEREYQLNKKSLEAVMGQGSDSQMFGLYPGGGGGIGEYLRQILKNQQQFSNRATPKIPQPDKFGFDWKTAKGVGGIAGSIGTLLGGIGDYTLAGVARDKFLSDEKQILSNIGLAKTKRAGDVVAWNNPVGQERAFQQTQGYSPDQLSKYIPQAAGYKGFGTETRS